MKEQDIISDMLLNHNDNDEKKEAWSLEKLILEFRNLLEDKTQLMEFYTSARSSKNMLQDAEFN